MVSEAKNEPTPEKVRKNISFKTPGRKKSKDEEVNELFKDLRK